jgi:hypothetical protein
LRLDGRVPLIVAHGTETGQSLRDRQDAQFYCRRLH